MNYAELGAAAYAAANISAEELVSMKTVQTDVGDLMGFALTKELVLASLDSKGPFVTHEGELYKMFDRIEIKAHHEYKEKKVGWFKTELEEYFAGFLVTLYYGNTAVLRRVIGGPGFSIENGDILNLQDLGGVVKTNVTEA